MPQHPPSEGLAARGSERGQGRASIGERSARGSERGKGRPSTFGLKDIQVAKAGVIKSG